MLRYAIGNWLIKVGSRMADHTIDGKDILERLNYYKQERIELIKELDKLYLKRPAEKAEKKPVKKTVKKAL